MLGETPFFTIFLALDFIQTQRIQYSHSSMLYDKSIAIHSNPSVLWVLRAENRLLFSVHKMRCKINNVWYFFKSHLGNIWQYKMLWDISSSKSK